MSEYEKEPIPGLPAELPPGESILWQGAPSWRALAMRTFHVRKVAIYFAILLAWRAASKIAEGADPIAVATSLSHMIVLAALGIGLLTFLAWATHRTTIYTITNRRVVMRFGIALPAAWNFPFKAMDTGHLKAFGDGTGNIALAVTGGKRMGYLALWPHVRPWHINTPEPMLRGVANAHAVAKILAEALVASGEKAVSVSPALSAPAQPITEPATQHIQDAVPARPSRIGRNVTAAA